MPGRGRGNQSSTVGDRFFFSGNHDLIWSIIDGVLCERPLGFLEGLPGVNASLVLFHRSCVLFVILVRTVGLAGFLEGLQFAPAVDVQAKTITTKPASTIQLRLLISGLLCRKREVLRPNHRTLKTENRTLNTEH